MLTFKKLFICVFAIFCINANAETLYVSDELSAFLHKGPGDEFKIIGKINSGEQVTLLEKQKRFSFIKDNRNRQGWILSSQLSSQPSSKEQVANLKQQVQELSFKLNNINEDWKQKTTEAARRLKTLQQQNEELLMQNATLKQNLEIVQTRNNDLEALLNAEKNALLMRWFMYGGSVLAAGLILGLIIPALIPRRKKSNWA